MGSSFLSDRRLVVVISVVLSFILTQESTASAVTDEEFSQAQAKLEAALLEAEQLETLLQKNRDQVNAAQKDLRNVNVELRQTQQNISEICICACCKVNQLEDEITALNETTEVLRSWMDSRLNMSSLAVVREADLQQTLTFLTSQMAQYINATKAEEGNPVHCKKIRPNVARVQQIWINSKPRNVSCDNEWTVIQKRQSGEVDFNRGWKDYVDGFGDADTEYWIGLKALNTLTSNGRWQLRVELGDWEGNTASALYNGFKVYSASDKYGLKLAKFVSGNAGDSLMKQHEGRMFTTQDQDNDKLKSGNCAKDNGGWWYASCLLSNLNGNYYASSKGAVDAVIWKSWKGYTYSLKTTLMKIRPD